jgi:hypothetical protein
LRTLFHGKLRQHSRFLRWQIDVFFELHQATGERRICGQSRIQPTKAARPPRLPKTPR